MLIVDSHCDTLLTVKDGRGPLINRYNLSRRFPQLQLFALFSSKDSRQAYEDSQLLLRAFYDEIDQNANRISQVRSYADIERTLASGKHAAMLSIEGGSALMGSTDILTDFYNAGVRVIGLAWLSNELAKSNRLSDGEADTGLSETGKKIVREGNRLGIIFDVSHLSDQSFEDLSALSSRPVIASHSNFRALCAHTRNLTDAQARRIFEQDGMIGLNLYPPFISQGEASVDMLFEHLDHGLALGGENHIGFGGDIDGIDSLPAPLNESEPIHDQLIELMLKRNYSESLVRKIAYENYLSFFKKYL